MQLKYLKIKKKRRLKWKVKFFYALINSFTFKKIEICALFQTLIILIAPVKRLLFNTTRKMILFYWNYIRKLLQKFIKIIIIENWNNKNIKHPIRITKEIGSRECNI